MVNNFRLFWSKVVPGVPNESIPKASEIPLRPHWGIEDKIIVLLINGGWN